MPRVKQNTRLRNSGSRRRDGEIVNVVEDTGGLTPPKKHNFVELIGNCYF